MFSTPAHTVVRPVRSVSSLVLSPRASQLVRKPDKVTAATDPTTLLIVKIRLTRARPANMLSPATTIAPTIATSAVLVCVSRSATTDTAHTGSANRPEI